MTVPEENRPKTESTDEVVERPVDADEQAEDSRTTGSAEGRTMREAMEEAGIEPEDFEERR